MTTNTPEQEATVRDWPGWPQLCARGCGRPAKWAVDCRPTELTLYACHFHLQYALDAAMAKSTTDDPVALVRRVAR